MDDRDHVVASRTLSTSQPKSLFQHEAKPNSIQWIRKMDMSRIRQELIAMKLGSFVQYASRYGPYLIIDILILSISHLSGAVVITTKGTFQVGSDAQE